MRSVFVSLGLLGVCALAVPATQGACPCKTPCQQPCAQPCEQPCGPPAMVAPSEPAAPTPAPEKPAPAEPSPAPAAEELPSDLELGSQLYASATPASMGVTARSAKIIGRFDANGRFNIFDNMSAIPENRVWTAYQFLTNMGNIGGAAASQTDAIRYGVEAVLTERISVAVQHQYISSASDSTLSNPQMLAKILLSESESSAVAATIGFAPEFVNNTVSAADNTSKVFLGLLTYNESESGDFFLQTAAQMGLPFRENDSSFHFDAGVSVGYWMMNPEPSTCCGCYTNDSFVKGIAPMVELYTKNVLGPGELGSFAVKEARNVVDATLGTQVLVGESSSIGFGVSVPLTGDKVRQSELLVTFNYGF